MLNLILVNQQIFSTLFYIIGVRTTLKLNNLNERQISDTRIGRKQSLTMY